MSLLKLVVVVVGVVVDVVIIKIIIIFIPRVVKIPGVIIIITTLVSAGLVRRMVSRRSSISLPSVQFTPAVRPTR